MRSRSKYVYYLASHGRRSARRENHERYAHNLDSGGDRSGVCLVSAVSSCFGADSLPLSATLADLPWNQVRVVLHLQVRKFCSDNLACERRVFTEALPTLAERYARKTKRLQDAVYLLGYALGGEAGARVAVGLGLSVSPDTLLHRVRQVRQSTPAFSEEVRVLGVDDLAYRRGHRYGTLLVDLQRRRLVDLLPERSAASLAAWLQAHPQIETVCRDRAEGYAEGTRQGAAQALQIVDRWHLLRNVAETLEEVLKKATPRIREAAYAVQPIPDGGHAPTNTQRQNEAAREKRLARYTQMRPWLAQHPTLSREELAKRAGVSCATLYRWLALEALAERKGMPRRERQIDPFVPYLKQRWEAGCHNGAQLLREIQEKGFGGTAAMLRHVTKAWRVPLREQQAGKRRWVPSPRGVTWLLLKPPAKRRPQEQAFVVALLQRDPSVQKAHELATSFFALLRKQSRQTLDEWLVAAQESTVPEVQRCANGFVKDKAVIAAAIEHSYSNGQTEGQVHRLKLIKRSMYGRANFDLLRARVLPMCQSA